MSQPPTTANTPAANEGARLSPIAKWGFTGFMAVLVPYYWACYGPTNFLYFCDIALFLTLAAVWTERRIYASMAAVGICAVQVVWQVDFLSTLFGAPLLGMTGYMFNPELSLFARGLSFFHFWLPLFVLYLVAKLGYDRRALIGWTSFAWVAMLISYFFLPAPGDVLAFANEPHNVNYVYGMDGSEAQTWMPQLAWLGVMMVGLPAIVYLPSHLLLRWWNPAGEKVTAPGAEVYCAA